jgi:uncharacterized protein YbaR (Trm112 family)
MDTIQQFLDGQAAVPVHFPVSAEPDQSCNRAQIIGQTACHPQVWGVFNLKWFEDFEALDEALKPFARVPLEDMRLLFEFYAADQRYLALEAVVPTELDRQCAEELGYSSWQSYARMCVHLTRNYGITVEQGRALFDLIDHSLLMPKISYRAESQTDVNEAQIQHGPLCPCWECLELRQQAQLDREREQKDLTKQHAARTYPIEDEFPF